MLEVFISC